ncbi:MAG: DUF1223 domain-containing protein [Polyangiaceae bacterium]
MSRRIALFILGAGLLGAGTYIATRSGAAPAGGPAPAPAPRGASAAAAGGARTPVLVELFTSEGCSSCPPADAELARLEATQPVAGVEIVPLAYHVDYWDRLGWRDPFSSSWASSRQRGYTSLGAGVYTPQAVVDGATDVLGSRGGAIERAAASSAREARAALRVVVGASRAGPASRDVTLEIGALPGGAGHAWVALVQRRAEVPVPRGENAGKTLAHTAIARSLVDAGAVAAAGGSARVTVNLPAGLTADGARVVAFVERAAPRRVVAVSVTDVPR